jgi:Flp pilus assembly protein TadG
MMTRGRRGSSAIEFALTLPILLVILAGILEYGWYLFQMTNVIHALRDGARIGVTVPLSDSTGPEARAATHARDVLNGLGVPCSESGGCAVLATITPAGDVEVMVLTIEVDYEPMIGLLPHPDQLRGNFTMLMQTQT